MTTIIISLFSGILFAIGLVLSGLTNPDKVIQFLDITGNWSYSMGVVMGAAVLVHGSIFYLIKAKKPWFSSKLYLPTKSELDKKLMIGALLFGVGWGLLGICPGPGILNLLTGQLEAVLFVFSMLGGMFFYKIFELMRS